MNNRQIILKNVKVHNLKNINLNLEPFQLIAFTGVSGSGKSSLAFDTLYKEGQRRYIESLSTFARRQMGAIEKPDLESASGMTPTISIEQKTAGKNPRSTVGTMTEIYDYLRVLFARVAIPHCPVSGEMVTPQSKERIIKTIQTKMEGKKLLFLAPFAKQKKGVFKEDFQELLRKGFTRLRIDGELKDLEENFLLDGTVSHDIDVVIDRLFIEKDTHSRIAEAVIHSIDFGNGVMSILDVEDQEETLFSTHAFSKQSGISYPSLEPQDFSFNTPLGMCNECNGLGTTLSFQLDKIIDENLSISQDCVSVASSYQTVRFGNIYDNLANLYQFSVKTPWKDLDLKAKHVFLYGTEKKWTKMHFIHPITGASWIDHIQWKGVLYEAKVRYLEAKSDRYRKKMQALMQETTCPSCQGARLKPYPAAALFSGKTLFQITQMTVEEALKFFQEVTLTETEQLIAKELLKEIQGRLKFLNDVGLHYLTLNRTAPTLSGGESQRVRLASQIGSGLVGITYILDEPSIGLHPRDSLRLIQTLKHLKNLGNTIIVVEHDEETIRSCDHIVDFGPLASSQGGSIVFNGSLKELLKHPTSLTGAYLSGRLKIEVPKKRRPLSKQKLKLIGASHHNLKEVQLSLPLGAFIAVTGVSGSGKSSLISETLYPALANHLHKANLTVGKYKAIQGLSLIDKVIAIDQSPIGRNPRSNPATYIKLFDEIRHFFSQLPESLAKGFLAGQFSFNVKTGSCPTCLGMGQVKVDLDFLSDVFVLCKECLGKRFDEETLSIYYKGKNIQDILEMDAKEALLLFSSIPSIRKKLETLIKVGLGYLKIGQSSTTLSGGEAQRVKLAKELTRPATGKTLYILDEPTTGLHFHDVNQLLAVLQELVDLGNTVLLIEHNMDVVKACDFVVDVGKEGGASGGTIVATGRPEKIAKLETPTGIALKKALYPSWALHSPPPSSAAHPLPEITISGAFENNLKHLDLKIPREKMTIFTGPSGSGKSSLAFDTLYSEGQRRYVESLSPYARQFVKQMPKPKVGEITGLSPAIAIEQKAHAGNPRSTVGTLTEIYDFLRLLFALKGVPHCPETLEEIKTITKESVAEKILTHPEGERVQILAPLPLKKSDSLEETLLKWQKKGFLRVRLNGNFFEIGETIPFNAKQKTALFLVVDRLVIHKNSTSRLREAIGQAAEIGEGQLVLAKDNEDLFFNLNFSVESTGKSYPPITPHTFSFNSEEGMCLDCLGLGVQYGAKFSQSEEILKQSPASLFKHLSEMFFTKPIQQLFSLCLEKINVEIQAPLEQSNTKSIHAFFNGGDETTWVSINKRLKVRFRGFDTTLILARKHAHLPIKEQLIAYLQEITCFSCLGSRLNPLARHVLIANHSITDLCQMPLEKTLQFIQTLNYTKEEKKLLEEIFTQLISRLTFLTEVGLNYLSLDRKAPTLSGGETQRIRLAKQLGSGLTGVLYVLDEPTIGLHSKDIAKLNQALERLKNLGNTLVLVEHDPETMTKADYIVDFGPHAGEKGGHITAKGTLQEILNNSHSLTGNYLSGRLKVKVDKKTKKFNPKEVLSIRNACCHNLKNLSLDIPLKALTCLTGVSGSGKSTLMEAVLLPAVQKGLGKSNKICLPEGEVEGIEAFDKIISLTQNPIGQTARSDVGTYVDFLPKLRDFFAQLPQAKMNGLQGKHFSTNHRRGMCTHCFGMGYRKVEMHFLPSVKVVCEECRGLRLNPKSLEVLYQGKSFGHYLECSVDELNVIFENHPRLTRILKTLIAVGLGYLKIGQEVQTLSCGEAQRIKLSKELSKRSFGKTLYLLDEPTTGLHADDVQKLLLVLYKLIDKGNTMVVIEHNQDFIACSDFVFELGPGAGDLGGQLIFNSIQP